MMDRTEHIEQCKQEAMRYVERGDLVSAVASMANDLAKVEGVNAHLLLLGGMYADNHDRQGVIRWIEGFR